MSRGQLGKQSSPCRNGGGKCTSGDLYFHGESVRGAQCDKFSVNVTTEDS